MRFIHSADWQLGRPFGRFEDGVRSALSDARFDAIDRIGECAVTSGTGHILVAGDIFDTEGPDDRTIIQALTRMQRINAQWWLLPGNHDFARNGGLWDRVRAKAPINVHLLHEAAPAEIEPGVWVLPAPLMHRHNLEDPTAAFDAMETPGAQLRIGLAHGSIRDFSSRGETNNQIAPDRAARSSLDYLALGDWHGALRVDARTWYAGTPEPDRFQRDDPGQVLRVDLAASREPEVEILRTGKFQWLKRDWRVDDSANFLSECDALFAGADAAATLLELSLSGIVSLADRVTILGHAENDLSHRLRYLDLKAADLVARPSADDLAAIEAEGMLGVAARTLEAMVEADGPDTAIARRALERLFVEYQRAAAL